MRKKPKPEEKESAFIAATMAANLGQVRHKCANCGHKTALTYFGRPKWCPQCNGNFRVKP